MVATPVQLDLGSEVACHVFRCFSHSDSLLVIGSAAVASSATKPPERNQAVTRPKRLVKQVRSYRNCVDEAISKGLPFIGSAFDLNKGKGGYFWFKFTEWGSEYGPIYQYKAFGKINVVIGKEKIANELMRERGNIYSSRENLPMASQLLCGNKRALFLPYGGMYTHSIPLKYNVF